MKSRFAMKKKKKKKNVYNTFHCWRNEINFRSGHGWSGTPHQKNVNKPGRDIETRMLDATIQTPIKEILR